MCPPAVPILCGMAKTRGNVRLRPYLHRGSAGDADKKRRRNPGPATAAQAAVSTPTGPPRFVSGWLRHPFGEGFSSGNAPAGRAGADRPPAYVGADEFGVPLGRDARALSQPEPARLRNGGFSSFSQRPAHRDGTDVPHHLPLREPVRRQSQRPTGRALRRSGTGRGNQAGLSLTVRVLRTAVDLLPSPRGRLQTLLHARRRTRSAWRCRPSGTGPCHRPSWRRRAGIHRTEAGCGHESACRLPPVLWTLASRVPVAPLPPAIPGIASPSPRPHVPTFSIRLTHDTLPVIDSKMADHRAGQRFRYPAG